MTYGSIELFLQLQWNSLLQLLLQSSVQFSHQNIIILNLCFELTDLCPVRLFSRRKLLFIILMFLSQMLFSLFTLPQQLAQLLNVSLKNYNLLQTLRLALSLAKVSFFEQKLHSGFKLFDAL